MSGSMINTILIDDEPQSIDTLSSLIELFSPNVNIVGNYTDPMKGMQAIQESDIDVLLLDIEMPGITGFELLKQLPEINFDVVFITAYNQYALDAIKLSALDYILKPVDPDELEAALAKVEAKKKERQTQQQLEILASLMDAQLENKKKKIALPTAEKIIYVNVSDILRVQAEQNYCLFIIKDRAPILISKNIGSYEKCLTSFGFMRVHRSHIVNLHCVNEYIRTDGGYLKLCNDNQIEVSSKKREELISRLEEL